MTFTKDRDIRAMANRLLNTRPDASAAEVLRKAAGMLVDLANERAHLTQPAQAVDALQDAIFQIAERLGEVRDPGMDDMSWHTQLIARAQYLANAQAVDVGGGETE